MATRKKTATKAARTEAAFVVVLEDLNAKFNVFGEALQGFREEVGVRFEQIDRRFEQVDRRFNQLELATLENSRAMTELGASVKRIESALATKVDRNEVEAIVEGKLARG
jgi:hypothetical protein